MWELAAGIVALLAIILRQVWKVKTLEDRAEEIRKETERIKEVIDREIVRKNDDSLSRDVNSVLDDLEFIDGMRPKSASSH